MTEFFVDKIWSVWLAGGWTLIPLFVLSLMIYVSAWRLVLYFRQREFKRIPEATWRRWILHPEEGRGEVGEIIRYTQDGVDSPGDIHRRFGEVVTARLPLINRHLTFLNIMVTAAPLIGLLGTVTGMLLTFRSIGMRGGEMADMMAAGISAALFPPEVGLCVALPGMMFVYHLRRRRDEYDAFLARLESHTVNRVRGWTKNDESFETARDNEMTSGERRTSTVAGSALSPATART